MENLNQQIDEVEKKIEYENNLLNSLYSELKQEVANPRVFTLLAIMNFSFGYLLARKNIINRSYIALLTLATMFKTINSSLNLIKSIVIKRAK